MRIPTYSSYMNMLNQTLTNKGTFDLYNFQSLTGLKAPTYAGYGMQAYNIVALESSLNVTTNFMQNNNITNIELKTMNTTLDSVYKDANEFKSMLLSFMGTSKQITPDYTGGKMTFNNDAVADYMGQTITIDGVQYTFANNGTGNNIDISAAANGEDVMTALYNKVSSLNPSITQNARELDFPLYTVNGTSSVLNVSGVATGAPHTMSPDQYSSMKNLQNFAFSTMLILSDSLNVNANGEYMFGGGNSYQPPVNFPFRNLDEFQAYYDGVNISYPSSSAANLSNFAVDAGKTGAITLELDSATGNSGTITAANAGAFLKEAVSANATTTGTLTFSQDANSVNATEYGAFNNFKAGDTMVIGGNVDPANAKMYTIKEISADGKTVKFESSTPVVNDEVVAPNDDVKFSSSFPVGAVINMNGFGNNIAPEVQVMGVSPDGTKLYVKVDPTRFPASGSPTTVQPSVNWDMSCKAYYQGGDLSNEKRISENQTLLFDIKASDPAFEKLFRALGEIAQGNLVDTRNPKDQMSGTIDPNHTSELVQQALDLLYSALNSTGGMSNQNKNSDMATVLAKVSSSTVVLNATIENQTLVQKNLSDDVTALKTVNQTEAATKALLAGTNLQASYAVLQNAMSISLLDYLK